MYYFYILRSTTDNELYYGSTDNLRRRLSEHNAGEVPSTQYRKPLELLYYEAYTLLELARQREHIVKRSGTAREALRKRIYPVRSSAG